MTIEVVAVMVTETVFVVALTINVYISQKRGTGRTRKGRKGNDRKGERGGRGDQTWSALTTADIYSQSITIELK